MANNIVATWGFKRKLPEPFEDYTDHAIFDDIASKYCTQPRKKSTLHAATLRAVRCGSAVRTDAGFSGR